jgi:hypothetical protein
MRLKTRIALVAVPVAAAVVAGTVVAVRVRLRRKKARQFLPGDLRDSVEELLRLKGGDFVPDGLGTSLYHRNLSQMTDRQLLSVYALVKAGEVLRSQGVINRRPTRAELMAASDEFHVAFSNKQGRDELLRTLEKFGSALLVEVAKDALVYLTNR